jgi:hypothetical protein
VDTSSKPVTPEVPPTPIPPAPTPPGPPTPSFGSPAPPSTWNFDEERKHLETLFSNRLNFYLVTSVAAFATTLSNVPNPNERRVAFLVLLVASVLMSFALTRTYFLINSVLSRILRDKEYEEHPYRRIYYENPLPNANHFLITIPWLLTLVLFYATVRHF